MPARALVFAVVLAALPGCADPFAPPPNCPLVEDAVLDMLPVRFARGEDVQLWARWDREVVPEDLPDEFTLLLLDEGGRERGAWPSAAGPSSVLRDVDILGQRTFLVDVGVPEEMPAGDYTMRVTYTPDPERCPGPDHEVRLQIE
jgi:hypothetical protein